MVILGIPNREFFMSDIVQGCIIKYSQQEKKAVKIQSLEYMKPINTPIKINGHFLYLHFGVTGLSLVNVSPHGLKTKKKSNFITLFRRHCILELYLVHCIRWTPKLYKSSTLDKDQVLVKR